MNKKRGIIIGVLTLAVVMMVGYAIFSETLTISGTATAKGDFDVSIECVKGVDETVITTEDLLTALGLDISEGGYENDTCSVTDDTMTFSVDLLYPGALRLFTAVITNNGSIDAILNTDTGVTETYSSCINGASDESTGCSTYTTGRYSIASGVDAYGFKKADGTIVTRGATDDELSEFISDDADGNSIMTLEPGESMYYLFGADLSSDVGNTTGGGYYWKSDATFKFNFTQPTS